MIWTDECDFCDFSCSCEYFEEGTQVWRPHTENSLNAGEGQNFNKWKLRLMLKVSYIHRLSWSISSYYLYYHQCHHPAKILNKPTNSFNYLFIHPTNNALPLLMVVTIASTHFTSPHRVEGWVDLDGLASYRGWSPIQVLTGPAIE